MINSINIKEIETEKITIEIIEILIHQSLNIKRVTETRAKVERILLIERKNHKNVTIKDYFTNKISL